MNNHFPRRHFLKLVGLASLTPFASSCTSSKKKPNILFIMVDDLGKEWTSCYGAEDIQTPNIDKLANTGMKFDNAYSMAQCTPSRATLLTGRYPFNTGWVNHWDVPRWGVGYFDWQQNRNVTFAKLLRNADYKTCAVGKWQINDFRLVPDALDKHGFDDWCMWTGGEGGNPPSDKRYWAPYINTPHGSKPYSGLFGPDLFCSYLLDFIKNNKNHPMMLYFPMVLTHTPFTTTPDEPDARSNLDKHKAMVRYVDKLVGRLMSTLDEMGIRNNTIIIFTTDNGTTKGITGTRNGRKIKGAKGEKSETGTCQPFIANCPRTIPAGITTKALTDFTDLLPTFCDLSGAEIPNNLDGVSIVPVLLGKENNSRRDWILSMGHGPARLDAKGVRGKHDYASRVLRDKQFKVWVNEQGDIDQLYDLLQDPYEENNLINSKKIDHQKVLAKFKNIISTFPQKDARPLYKPRALNVWDRKISDYQ